MSQEQEEPLAPGHVEEPKERNSLGGRRSPAPVWSQLEPGTMQPLIQAHTVGPQPLSRPDCAPGAGGVGAESILRRPAAKSVLWDGEGCSHSELPWIISALWDFSVLGSLVRGKSKGGIKCDFWKKLRGSKIHLHLVLKEGGFGVSGAPVLL